MSDGLSRFLGMMGTICFVLAPAFMLEITLVEAVRACLGALGIHIHPFSGIAREFHSPVRLLLFWLLAFAIGYVEFQVWECVGRKRDAAKQRKREVWSRKLQESMLIPDEVELSFEEYLAMLSGGQAATESGRLAFLIAGLLPWNPVGALRIARLCLETREAFHVLIVEGFAHVGTAQMSHWFQQSQVEMDRSLLSTGIDERPLSPEMKAYSLEDYAEIVLKHYQNYKGGTPLCPAGHG